MNKAISSVVVALAVLYGAACIVHAATLDDAKAFAMKAAGCIKANGVEKALADLNDPKGPGVKGDLYVTVQDLNAVARANPMFPGLVNSSATNMGAKDADGKLFMKEAIELVKAQGGGWTTYRWTNPATKKGTTQEDLGQKVEGHDLFVMCGIFQQGNPARCPKACRYLRASCNSHTEEVHNEGTA